jgi:hypothetical protein
MPNALLLASLTLAALAQDAPKPPAPPQEAQEAAKEPEQPRGLLVNAPGAFQGYALYAPLRSGRTVLVDMAGEVVHEWKHGLPTMSNYLLDDGHLLAISRLDDNPTFFGGGIGGRIQELDWDGKVVWDWTLSTETQITHHDVERMPNGHVLVIVWERIDAPAAIALGRDPEALGKPGWWVDAVLEVEPVRPDGAKIVWEWHMSDHLVQDLDRTKANYGSPADRPERIDANFDLRPKPPMTPEELAKEKEREKAIRDLGYSGGDDDDDDPPAKPAEKKKEDPKSRARERGDWTHVNSVDYDAKNDLILLSSPELCEIFVIDHSTTTAEARTSSGGRYGKGGDVLWRWGNPKNYGAGTDRDRRLFYQHQPEWIPAGHPGAGRVLVFNNGSRRPGIEHSTVDELVLPFDPEKGFLREKGQPFGPKAPELSYAAPKKEEFFSFFISGCHRLPNGNTFICSGKQGRIFEVTAAGEIVWEFWNPWGGELVQKPAKADPNQDPNKPTPVQPTSVFRATKLAPDHPALKGRTLTPIAQR